MYDKMYVHPQHFIFISIKLCFLPQNSSWRANNYYNQQRDPDWYRYLRRQADRPPQPGMPYGKRRKAKSQPQTQGTILYDDGDLGISKIDFTSPPVTLSWMDLQAKAPPQDKGIKRTITKALFSSKEVGESKMLLKGVSGIAKPGQLVAIMGASGAGKTTLMNILTHRRPGTLKVTGEVRVNGTKMGRNINRVAGYVQQEELFIPSMTAREHLHFHVK
jgi:ABC-type multidrug transport system fused ATPase/permease subunit